MKKLAIINLLLIILLALGCQKDNDISEPPADITGLQAIAEDSKITLAWVAPDNANIKNYSITYGPNGALITRDNTPVVISNLINGVTYEFTVKARDIYGNLSTGVTITATPMSENVGEAVPYAGNVSLTSQAQVNAWNENFNCIIGDVTIEGTDITNLDALQHIDSIVGKLKIQYTELQNLHGFHHLQKVTNSLVIWGNDVLEDDTDLSNLTHLGNDLTIMSNAVLPNLDGFSGLEYIATDVYIGLKGWQNPAGAGPNPLLTSFCGLTQVAAAGGINGTVYIDNNGYNPTLQDLISGNCAGDGTTPQNVSGFTANAGDSQVVLTWQLPSASINGLQLTYAPGGASAITLASDQTSYTVPNLANGTEYTFTMVTVSDTGQSTGISVSATPGAAVYNGNVQLNTQADVNAFPATVTTITGKLQIFGDDITDLSPLANITTIQGKLEFIATTALQTLNGLNIQTTGGNVYLSDNTALTDITALESLTSIGKDLVIIGNTALTSLDGLQNVTYIERHVYIGIEGWLSPAVEHGNPLLTDFCALKTVFEAGGQDNDYIVQYNATNPTIQEILNNCN